MTHFHVHCWLYQCDTRERRLIGMFQRSEVPDHTERPFQDQGGAVSKLEIHELMMQALTDPKYIDKAKEYFIPLLQNLQQYLCEPRCIDMRLMRRADSLARRAACDILNLTPDELRAIEPADFNTKSGKQETWNFVVGVYNHLMNGGMGAQWEQQGESGPADGARDVPTEKAPAPAAVDGPELDHEPAEAEVPPAEAEVPPPPPVPPRELPQALDDQEFAAFLANIRQALTLKDGEHAQQIIDDLNDEYKGDGAAQKFANLKNQLPRSIAVDIELDGKSVKKVFILKFDTAKNAFVLERSEEWERSVDDAAAEVEKPKSDEDILKEVAKEQKKGFFVSSLGKHLGNRVPVTPKLRLFYQRYFGTPEPLLEVQINKGLISKININFGSIVGENPKQIADILKKYKDQPFNTANINNLYDDLKNIENTDELSDEERLITEFSEKHPEYEVTGEDNKPALQFDVTKKSTSSEMYVLGNVDDSYSKPKVIVQGKIITEVVWPASEKFGAELQKRVGSSIGKNLTKNEMDNIKNAIEDMVNSYKPTPDEEKVVAVLDARKGWVLALTYGFFHTFNRLAEDGGAKEQAFFIKEYSRPKPLIYVGCVDGKISESWIETRGSKNLPKIDEVFKAYKGMPYTVENLEALSKALSAVARGENPELPGADDAKKEKAEADAKTWPKDLPLGRAPQNIEDEMVKLNLTLADMDGKKLMTTLSILPLNPDDLPNANQSALAKYYRELLIEKWPKMQADLKRLLNASSDDNRKNIASEIQNNKDYGTLGNAYVLSFLTLGEPRHAKDVALRWYVGLFTRLHNALWPLVKEGKFDY